MTIRIRFAPARRLILFALVFMMLTIALPVAHGQLGGSIPYNVTITGNISPQIPLSLSLFTGKAGDLVSIFVTSTDGLLNPIVSIVGPDQQVLASSDDDPFGPSPLDAYVSAFLPLDGDYAIQIHDVNQSIGGYLMRLNGRSPVEAQVLAFGAPVKLDVPPQPQPQYLTFTAENCPTTLTITDTDQGDPFTFPFFAIVRDEKGNRMAMLQGGRVVEDLITVAPNSGKYEIEVVSAHPTNPDAYGSITVQVDCAGSEVPMCKNPDAGRLTIVPRQPAVTPTPTRPPQSNSTPVQRVCGNGILERGEGCEPANTATCDAQCQPIQANQCGNGVVQPELGEQCDPPNGGTFCDGACHYVPPPTAGYCGDGIVQAELGEQCEPPDATLHTTCDGQCQNYKP